MPETRTDKRDHVKRVLVNVCPEGADFTTSKQNNMQLR